MQIIRKQSFTVKLTLLGILSFFIFLIATIPARPFASMLQEASPIILSNVNGTIWSGKSDQLVISNIPLGKLSWSVGIFSLLTGKFTADIKLQNPDLKVDGVVGFGFNKQLILKNMDIQTDSRWLMNTAMLPVSVTGKLVGNIDYLYLTTSDETPLPTIDTKANIAWQNAGTDYPEPFTLGDFSVALSKDEKSDTIIIKLVDAPKTLPTKGEIKLQPSGQYTVDLTLTPSQDLPDSIKNALAFIGKPERDGSYIVLQQGQLQDYLDLND